MNTIVKLTAAVALCLAFLAPAVASAQQLTIKAYPAISLPAGKFRLVNYTSMREGGSLESNLVAPGSYCQGASFMANTAPGATGQTWLATPAGNGYYYLTSEAGRAKGMQLEGNRPGAKPFNAAFLAKAGRFSGQMWKVVPTGGGYFALTTAFVEREQLFLDGGKLNTNDPGSAARMMKPGVKPGTNEASFYAGQCWKFIPVR